MPTTIYDSSQITKRRAEKTISGSFISRISPWNTLPAGQLYVQTPQNQPNTGFAPLLGISQQSIINAVKTGQMTEYRKNDGGCITISSGCPCNIPAIVNSIPSNIIASVDGSLQFTGSNVSYIPSTPTGASFLGAGDFLIQGFFKIPSAFTDGASFKLLEATSGAGQTALVIGKNSGQPHNITLFSSSLPGPIIFFQGNSIVNNNWQFFQFWRTDDDLFFALNGNSGSTSPEQFFNWNNTNITELRITGSGTPSDILVSNIRIGTNSFSVPSIVPTSKLLPINGTILLLNTLSNDPFSDEMDNYTKDNSTGVSWSSDTPF
jgi:hypothetical protein